MKFHVVINSVKSVDELQDAWSSNDYTKLLEDCGLDDNSGSSSEELRELVFMALSDLEPTEAAELVLNHRLSQHLNENQISQVSHEMLLDTISEEYADIALHHELFNVNQLLYKAFNGKFPNAKATIIEFEMAAKQPKTSPLSKEEIIKAFDATLVKNHVIKRLFAKQIAGKEPFEEAEGIIWRLEHLDSNHYRITTSDYWMSKEDFTEAEFDVNVIEFEDEDDN